MYEIICQTMLIENYLEMMKYIGYGMNILSAMTSDGPLPKR